MVRVFPPATPPALPFALVSGNYYDYNFCYVAGASAGSALSANTLYTTIMNIPIGATTFSAVQISVTATGTATAARVGFYALGSDGKPGNLILELASTFDVSGTGDKEVTQTITLPPGVVLPTLLLNGTCTVHAYGTTSTSMLGYTSASSTTKISSFNRAFAYAALPSSFGTPNTLASGGPRIALKAV